MSIATSLSALDKALSLSRQVAGKAVQGAGTGSLESPSRPVVPPGTETRAFAIRDKLEISAQARELHGAHAGHGADGAEGAKGAASAEGAAANPAADSANPLHLTESEKAHVQELRARDAEVRAHENAHASAGGGLAGAPSYEFQQGPDGRQYAVGGEVPIQVKEGATPEETLRIANQVRAAALAPANPSSADMAVAASASSLEMKARAEQSEQRMAELNGETEEIDPAGRRSADVTEIAVGEGGSFDARVRDYSQPPTPAIDLPQLISVFG
ncbi:MAG: hypothetical protein HKN12_06110 [Gemmatimonadetes bacterium]|nr:hypothetical protein [Gemmatimonadota bacterium]